MFLLLSFAGVVGKVSGRIYSLIHKQHQGRESIAHATRSCNTSVILSFFVLMLAHSNKALLCAHIYLCVCAWYFTGNPLASDD